MPNYKTLYYDLFRAHNKAIELLIKAGQDAEALVMNCEEPLDFPIVEHKQEEVTTKEDKKKL